MDATTGKQRFCLFNGKYSNTTMFLCGVEICVSAFVLKHTITAF